MPLRKLLWITYVVLLCSCSTLSNSQNPSSNICVRGPAKAYGEAPPAIVTVPGNRFYSDSQSSVIDEALYKQNEEARKPLRKYLDEIIKMTEAAAQGDRDASLAVNKWLLKWAEGESLTKVESPQGGFERKWLLSGILISYLGNKPYSEWEHREKIVSWLSRLTHLMTQDYLGYEKTSQRNNHVYWAGLVAIEMSLINNNKELLNWGLEKIRYGLSEVDANGFLPLELERKSRALQYHRVSLEALLMAAYLLKESGIDLMIEYNGALDRLAQTTLRGLQNPEIFVEKTGMAQVFKLNESTDWIPIYASLKPDNLEALKVLRTTPVNWNRALGGKPLNFLEKNKSKTTPCEN
jgi:poly(beta-D-mannuronate) lyase